MERSRGSELHVRARRRSERPQGEQEEEVVYVKRVVIVNVAATVGWLLSALVVPPATPVWLWALAGAAAILIFNIVLCRRTRMGLPTKLPWPGALRGRDFVWLAVTVLLILLGYWVRSWP